ncbi:unnamed protein product [Symbiodinium microadriaticum]|nr:unnamed protein product [Symbiodinium microadriaticum]
MAACMPAALTTLLGPSRESWGWVPPMAAPVLSQHCTSQPLAWPSNSHKIRPPPGLEVPEVAEITTANLRFGMGSFGHPHFCTRPCVHISKGGVCPSGTTCAYCHFPHRAMSKPDCRLRQRLLDASDQELLATFLPFIFKKAATEGLMPRVDRLLQLLHAEMKDTQSDAIDLIRFRPMRMSFMRLGQGQGIVV